MGVVKFELRISSHDDACIFHERPILQQGAQYRACCSQYTFIGSDLLPFITVEGYISKQFPLKAVMETSFNTETTAFGSDQYSGTLGHDSDLKPDQSINEK